MEYFSLYDSLILIVMISDQFQPWCNNFPTLISVQLLLTLTMTILDNHVILSSFNLVEFWAEERTLLYSVASLTKDSLWEPTALHS